MVPSLQMTLNTPQASGCRCRRFTLLEALLAMVILAMMASGVFASIMLARHVMTSARHHQEAQALAFDYAWTLFHQDYEELLNYDSPTTEPVPADSPLFPYGGTVRQSVVVHSDHCQILVRVDWQEPTFGTGTKALHQSHTVHRYNTAR